MANINLEPYLYFNGNAKEAMEFYKSVFGGELEMQTMEQVPEDILDDSMKERKNDVMHASLKGPVNLMASDSQKASEKAAKVELSLGGTDEAKMRSIFEALAESGEIKMPLEKQFWGDIFGSLTDKFGVDWMMNIGTKL